jgi:hypothetical protein
VLGDVVKAAKRLSVRGQNSVQLAEGLEAEGLEAESRPRMPTSQ